MNNILEAQHLDETKTRKMYTPVLTLHVGYLYIKANAHNV